ncbi:hypothetical protein RJT34_03127 [Clitoria ternatea]|uniref:Fe2OG dioxygenase domain-containing protein n=1 Tax=Clitoria ternatea TaxID=43366 RepID=A0AAN9Q0Y7_CLITE
MESSAATLVHSLPSKGFNFQVLNKETQFPEQFVWPLKDLVKSCDQKLDTPLIDLKAIKNDDAAMAAAAELVRKACMKHGFFEVTNHGIDHDLIAATYQEFESFFNLPLAKKQSARNNVWGYSSAHADRFTSNLPWKQIFTYPYNYISQSPSQVVDFFKVVNQRYCDAMKELSMDILELLGVSLGADRSHFQKYFEDCEGIMRGNSYPACANFNLTFGVGPHCDPTSLTILHQDQIGGLEVFVDDKWLPVPPRPQTPDAFVINIGDTFSALSNGLYKSCLHRVLVNEKAERKSLTFFMNPRGDKIVKPPHNLFNNQEERKFPDFTWSQLFGFTQKRHRADADTLPNFVTWLRSSNQN